MCQKYITKIKIEAFRQLTMSDLAGAISEIVGGSVANDVEDENNITKPGEHIVVYWVENKVVAWCLGIVEKVQRDCVMVINLKQSMIRKEIARFCLKAQKKSMCWKNKIF